MTLQLIRKPRQKRNRTLLLLRILKQVLEGSHTFRQLYHSSEMSYAQTKDMIAELVQCGLLQWHNDDGGGGGGKMKNRKFSQTGFTITDKGCQYVHHMEELHKILPPESMADIIWGSRKK